MLDTGLILTLFLAAVVIAFIFKGIVVIRSSERMIIERFGTYVHTLEAGINFIIPFVDRPREFIWKKAPSDNALSRLLGESSDGHLAAAARIDIRETVLDMPSQTVFTKDNVSVHINALLYIEITKPHDAVYRISNLPNAIEKLTQTTLRSLVGEMELDKTLSSREQINSRLQIILDEAAFMAGCGQIPGQIAEQHGGDGGEIGKAESIKAHGGENSGDPVGKILLGTRASETAIAVDLETLAASFDLNCGRRRRAWRSHIRGGSSHVRSGSVWLGSVLLGCFLSVGFKVGMV
ncbi:MAG: paraslipin [Ghiorsea sp.]|nr:paraslipin [Ghiorsea sp.]